jgi:hypothetical protein
MLFNTTAAKVQAKRKGWYCLLHAHLILHDMPCRKPEEDPVWLQQQMQAEMAAEQQAAQQSQAIKMFSALLSQNSNAAAAAAAATGSATQSAAGSNPLEVSMCYAACVVSTLQTT